MAYKDVTPPAGGKISVKNGKLNVPDNRSCRSFAAMAPGRTSGPRASSVFDAAVQKAYGGKRKIVLVRSVRRRNRQEQIR